MCMWESSPRITSLPLMSQCTSTDIRLAMVPDGTKSAASFPNNFAISVSKRKQEGSRPRTSSSTSALAIAPRIASVGFVTVSDRRSTILATIFSATKTSHKVDVLSHSCSSYKITNTQSYSDLLCNHYWIQIP
ncbi:hypothetical protein V8G54_034575 [Vigna mungo]|uniref:Uncharacterized protein n=1 Tax=Vigna mungo TaxID=3915 RepID=A0AAQ3RJV1_VIGMU